MIYQLKTARVCVHCGNKRKTKGDMIMQTAEKEPLRLDLAAGGIKALDLKDGTVRIVLDFPKGFVDTGADALPEGGFEKRMTNFSLAGDNYHFTLIETYRVRGEGINITRYEEDGSSSVMFIARGRGKCSMPNGMKITESCIYAEAEITSKEFLKKLCESAGFSCEEA